jgi:hypothetical protein
MLIEIDEKLIGLLERRRVLFSEDRGVRPADEWLKQVEYLNGRIAGLMGAEYSAARGAE